MKTLKPLRLTATPALPGLSAEHATGVMATMPNDAEGFIELSDGSWDAKTAATFSGICEAGSQLQ